MATRRPRFSAAFQMQLALETLRGEREPNIVAVAESMLAATAVRRRPTTTSQRTSTPFTGTGYDEP